MRESSRLDQSLTKSTFTFGDIKYCSRLNKHKNISEGIKKKTTINQKNRLRDINGYKLLVRKMEGALEVEGG